MSGLPTIRDLKRMLIARADDLVPLILRDVHQEGSDLVGRARDGTKIKVVNRGPKRGLVLDTSDPHSKLPNRRGGNLFNLVANELADGTPKGGIRASLRILGHSAVDDASLSTRPRYAVRDLRRSAEDRTHNYSEHSEHRRQIAWDVWTKALPMAAESPAYQYLSTRACLLVTPALRSGQRRHPDTKELMEVMVAIVINPISMNFLGVHVTHLERRDNLWVKAVAQPTKIVIGPIGGGIIPLTRGPRGLPIGKARDEDLLIGEGIENSLSGALYLGEPRCWAALFVGNLPKVRIPPHFRRVIVIRDRDGDNQGVHHSRSAMIANWSDEGHSIAFLDPPRGYKDLNEWWQCRQALLRHADVK